MFFVLSADMFALVAIAVGLAAVFLLRGRTSAWVIAAVVGMIAVSPALIGYAGYELGMSKVNAVLPLVDPEQKDALLAAGTDEAMQNVRFGVGSLLCTVPGLAMLFIVAAMGKAPQPDNNGGI